MNSIKITHREIFHNTRNSVINKFNLPKDNLNKRRTQFNNNNAVGEIFHNTGNLIIGT